jgi:hypothetical protein
MKHLTIRNSISVIFTVVGLSWIVGSFAYVAVPQVPWAASHVSAWAVATWHQGD